MMGDFVKWLRDRYDDSHNPMHDEEYDLANLCAEQNISIAKFWHGTAPEGHDCSTSNAEPCKVLERARRFQDKYG